LLNAVAICGSPRTNGNTEKMLQKCLQVLQDAGIDGELVRLANKVMLPCVACGSCGKNKDKQCVIKDDDFDEIFIKMLRADIIIVGSPVYFGSATPQLMSLLDRAGYVSRSNGGLFGRKIGGPVVVARRAGQNFTFAQLLYWFLIGEMVVPGSTYWNVGIGHKPGEVLDDQEGMETITRFAENVAWVAKKLYPV